MNHTSIVNNLAGQIERRKKLEHLGHPFILGELNSIAGEGVTGETNVFGDALWLVDFSLWAGQHVSPLRSYAPQESISNSLFHRASNVFTSTKEQTTDTPRGNPSKPKQCQL